MPGGWGLCRWRRDWREGWVPARVFETSRSEGTRWAGSLLRPEPELPVTQGLEIMQMRCGGNLSGDLWP